MKKQWKGFVFGLLVATLVFGLGVPALAATMRQLNANYSGIKITLDGKEIVPKDANGVTVEPFAVDGTTYLPLRPMASALGLDVVWDGATQTVKLTTPGKVPAENKPEQTPTATETMGQKNALAKANSYLSMTAFSYSGLVKQLEFEKFSHEDAVYGADNCGADWNEQAVKKAKSYLALTSFSKDGLIRQLEFEGFTNAQAVYGAEQNGY